MKKLLLICAILLSAASAATAQEWKETLKKVATAAADKATDGKLTGYALTGTWDYTAPGVKFEGGDLLSEAGGAVLSGNIASRLEKAYLIAGIRPGAGRFVFSDDGTFTATMGRHALDGTYTFDAATHRVTLRFARGQLDLGSFAGHAYISGERLQLLFPMTKLVDLATRLGSRISSLNAVTGLLRKYENVYLGFEFERAAKK